MFCPECGAPITTSASFCSKCGRSLVAAPQAPPAAAATHGNYARFMPRFWAWIVDGILCGIVGFVVSIFAGWDTTFLGLVSTTAVPAWLYFALQESAEAQATVGKKLFGMKVTDSAGRRLTFGQASIRYLIKAVVTLVPFGILASAILLATDDRARTIHDRAASTLVWKT